MMLLPIALAVTLWIHPPFPALAFGFVALVEYAVLTFVFAALMPYLIRWIWKGEALRDNTLRKALEAMAQRAGIGYRDVILLHTKQSKLANAWVAGILPRFRFVLVTDYLVEHLTPSELEAIFAHELGHLKHRHLPKQVGWLVLSFAGTLLLIRLTYLMLGLLSLPTWLLWLSGWFIALVPIVLLVKLGLMRFWRRMEFEADAYAAELTKTPEVLSQALTKLHQLNQTPQELSPLDEKLMTHPSLQVRVAAIEKLRLQDAT